MVGAGAVGLGVGSCLVASGADVCFVTPPGGAAPLQARGLERTGVLGSFRCDYESFDVSEDLEEGLAGADFVLVCTKTHTSRRMAATLAEFSTITRGEVPVVLFQNGWGSAEIFAEMLPSQSVFNARVISGFVRSARHVVEITVHADAIRMGSLFGSDPGVLNVLATAIAQGGIPCELTDRIDRDLWAKMLYNCALNPLGALHDLPYGELADRAVARQLMDLVIDEIFEVMDAHDFETHWSSASEYRRDFYGDLLPTTRAHESSMLLDLRAGRETEIDSLCGAVVGLAQQGGGAAPVNRALTDLVRAVTVTRGKAVSRT